MKLGSCLTIQRAYNQTAMKIIVIDDHALMRELLMRACREAVPQSNVFGAGTAQSGLILCQAKQPDLIILDLSLPDRDGLSLLPDLLAVCPGGKVIGLSGYSDEFTLNQVLHSKLNGFVDKKEQSFDQLAAAIETVMRGRRYFPESVDKSLQSQKNNPTAFNKILSSREQQLLRLFGQGLEQRADCRHREFE